MWGYRGGGGVLCVDQWLQLIHARADAIRTLSWAIEVTGFGPWNGYIPIDCGRIIVFFVPIFEWFFFFCVARNSNNGHDKHLVSPLWAVLTKISWHSIMIMIIMLSLAGQKWSWKWTNRRTEKELEHKHCFNDHLLMKLYNLIFVKQTKKKTKQKNTK